MRPTARLLLPLAPVAWLAAVPPAPAHHSFAAEFDAHQPMTVTGVVTRVEFMNPHIYFYAHADQPEVDGLGAVPSCASTHFGRAGEGIGHDSPRCRGAGVVP